MYSLFFLLIVQDVLFVVFTIAFWSGTTFLFGVVAFGNVAASQSLAFSALWTLYALIVDNILSWLFLYHLFKCRSQVSNTDRLKVLWRKSVWGLSLLCGTTWISLILIIMATFTFHSDGLKRALVYRIAYAFSPLQFTGALVFIYTIRSLFEDAKTGAEEEEEEKEEETEEEMGIMNRLSAETLTWSADGANSPVVLSFSSEVENEPTPILFTDASPPGSVRNVNH